MSDLLGLLTATLLTLAIFSHVWRKSSVSRAAQHLVLGALAGYVAAVLVRTVLLPGLVQPLAGDFSGNALHLIPLLLIILLAFRFLPYQRLHALGLIPLGLLLGISSALALAGALRGTLAPQLLVAVDLSFLPRAPTWLDALSVGAATFTTIAVVLYFQRRARPDDVQHSPFLQAGGALGYWALMVAFGALLATTAGARITLLIDRLLYFEALWRRFLGGG